jgi:hypothetical protein
VSRLGVGVVQSGMLEAGDFYDSASGAAGKAALSQLAGTLAGDKKLFKDCAINKFMGRLAANSLQGFPLEGARRVGI